MRQCGCGARRREGPRFFVGGAGLRPRGSGLGAGPGRRAASRRGVPPFRPRVPSAVLRPAHAFGVTVAAFHLLAALAAPEPAMSGPNGDLGMPVEAGAEGEDDSFGEAGDSGELPKGPLLYPGVPLGKGIGSGIGA